MVCAPVRKEKSPSFSEGIIDRTGAQTMLYLTCTTITSVDLAHYGVSRVKDWVSRDCGTRYLFDFLQHEGILCVSIRIASKRRF